MGDWDAKNVINASDMYAPPKRRLEPRVDKTISEIVGKQVLARDPRLINLVVKFQQNKDIDAPDNLFENSKFINELKQVFSKPL